MSAKYCIFGPLNLHLLGLYLCYFLIYFFFNFGILAFCRSLSENWGFEAKMLKIRIFLEMGSSATLLGLSARAHNSPQPTAMCRKWAFKPSALEPTHVELERTRPQQPSTHRDAPQSRRLARVSSSAPCRTRKNAKSYQSSNQQFPYDKSTSSSSFAKSHAALVLRLVSCKRGVKESFLLGPQTLMLIYKAIAIPSL
jgi:hypothetical protein